MATKKISDNDLADNEKIFCDNYLIDFRGSKAAILAGYSKKNARFQASRLLSIERIQKYLATRSKQTSKKLKITEQKTKLEIGRVCYSDIRNVINSNGTVKPLQDIDDDTARAISSYEVDEVTEGLEKTFITVRNVKVKFWDKNKGLAMMSKHQKLYSDAPIVHQNNTIKIDLSKYTDDELRTIDNLQRKGRVVEA